MEKALLKVLSNDLSGDYFILKLITRDLDIKPGQFLNILIKEKALRRPISICDYQDNIITLAIKINGEGTRLLSRVKKDDMLDVILPLGNGIDLSNYDKEILLIGGGIGVAPLLYIARCAKEKGLRVTSVLGFSDPYNTILIDDIRAYSNQIYISYDSQGKNVVDILKEKNLNGKYFACGPIKMLKNVSLYNKNGYCSLESRMGCGFGACMGCSTEFKSGRKRICKEGPVFESKDIIWENLT